MGGHLDSKGVKVYFYFYRVRDKRPLEVSSGVEIQQRYGADWLAIRSAIGGRFNQSQAQFEKQSFPNAFNRKDPFSDDL